MTSKTWVSGTVIDSAWLQDVDNTVYKGTVAPVSTGFLSYIFGRTSAETSAGITPTNYAYFPGDPRRYGAVGDDSTDNATAFAKWTTVGGVMTLPQGVWRSSTGIRATNSDCHITGMGHGVSVLKPVGWVDGILVGDNTYPSAFQVTRGVTVENLTIDGTLQTASTTLVTAGSFVASTTYNIVSVGTTNWVAIGAASNTVGISFIATGVGAGSGTAHTVIDTYGNGVNLNCCDDVIVRGVQLKNIKNQGIVSTFYQLAGVTQRSIQIINNNIVGSNINQIAIGLEGASSNAVVSGNTLSGIQADGIQMSYAGGGFVTNGVSTISNNVIQGAVAATIRGIYIGDNMYNVVINGNIIYGFGVSIRCSYTASSTGDYTIVGNKCYQWTDGGILGFPMNGADNTEMLIEANNIKSTVASGSSYGILAAKGTTIVGNRVRSGAVGIGCSGSGQRILSNTIEGPTVSINTNSATGVVIQGNYVDTQPVLSADTIYSRMRGYGGTIASAATISIPLNGDFFLMSGTTTVDTVNGGNVGDVINFSFQSAIIFSNAGNIKSGGALARDADDMVQLAYRGTNWYRIASAAN